MKEKLEEMRQKHKEYIEIWDEFFGLVDKLTEIDPQGLIRFIKIMSQNLD